MTFGLDNIWGYDPVTLRRTTQFMAYGQGMTDPKQLDALVDQPPFTRMPPYALRWFASRICSRGALNRWLSPRSARRCRG